MDLVMLSRIQFALTSCFHYIYVPISIGLGLFLVIVETLYLTTKNPAYEHVFKFWLKVFALSFAIGVGTGFVQIFEFGTNWARYSKFVGDVFGSALGAEGVFAFFLESGFLAILLFGWSRVGKITHYISTILVCLGAHFSSFWIVVANSWMQTPAGYRIVGTGATAKAEITDFWAMVFNPSSVDRVVHVVLGCWLVGAFLVLSVSAYYLLKNRFEDFAKKSFKIGLSMATVAILLQGLSGDSTARGVAFNQPVKLAALEGVFKTVDTPAPMYLFGNPNPATQQVEDGIKIPALLSFLVYRNPHKPVLGLDIVPPEDRPSSPIVFRTYRVMLGMFTLMFFTVLWCLFKLWRKTFFSSKWTLRWLVFSVVFPQIGNIFGWITAEVGRQPWIVYNMLRTSDGVSPTVLPGQVMGSIIMFLVIYTFMFSLFIYLLNFKIKHGPTEDPIQTYHDPYESIKEGS